VTSQRAHWLKLGVISIAGVVGALASVRLLRPTPDGPGALDLISCPILLVISVFPGDLLRNLVSRLSDLVLANLLVLGNAVTYGGLAAFLFSYFVPRGEAWEPEPEEPAEKEAPNVQPITTAEPEVTDAARQPTTGT